MLCVEKPQSVFVSVNHRAGLLDHLHTAATETHRGDDHGAEGREQQSRLSSC